MLEQFIGFDASLFRLNTLYEEDLEVFEQRQNEYFADELTDETLWNVCSISGKLDDAEYTLEIHSYMQTEKIIEIIVWNKMGDKIEFCSTENKINDSRVRIGSIML